MTAPPTGKEPEDVRMEPRILPLSNEEITGEVAALVH
jgi:hypothetical protein